MEFSGDVRGIQISQVEIDYLLKSVNQYFQHQLTQDDVIWSYAGARPLYEEVAQDESNHSKVTHDYAFWVDNQNGVTPVLTILGGKLTTYRKLAEHALGELKRYFPEMTARKMATEVLPGGHIGTGGQTSFVRKLREQFPWLPEQTARRFTRLYGDRTFTLIADASSFDDLGKVFGAERNWVFV